MTETAANYISIDLKKRFRDQARRVWAASAIAVLAWVTLIVIAPVMLFTGFNSVSSPLYTFFSYICHQMPERSLYLAGHQMAVCSRCFGVYFGLLLGMIAYPVWRSVEETEPIPRFWLFASLIPITIDWSLTVFGIWENTHGSRLVTGLVLGFACSTFIVPALVEVVRNFSVPRARTQ